MTYLWKFKVILTIATGFWRTFVFFSFCYYLSGARYKMYVIFKLQILKLLNQYIRIGTTCTHPVTYHGYDGQFGLFV